MILLTWIPAVCTAYHKGVLYVADHYNCRVHEITGQGSRTFGTKAAGRGRLHHPWGVAVDRQDRIIVTESESDRVSIFNGNSLAHLQSFGSYGTAHGQFNGLQGVCVDSQVSSQPAGQHS